jgi:CRP-like cAMP-binding protein
MEHLDLISRIAQFKSANSKNIKLLESLFMPITFRKGTLLSPPEHAYPILYYIQQGLVRGYYLIEDQEYSSWVIENGFLLPLNNTVDSQPNSLYISFMETTSGWSLNLAKAELIAQNDTQLNRILIEIYDEKIQEAHQREMILRIPQAKKRMEIFMQYHSSIATKINNNIFASLLQINLKYFSKIKKQYLQSQKTPKNNNTK